MHAKNWSVHVVAGAGVAVLMLLLPMLPLAVFVL